MIYLDTSALVKRFIDEPGAEHVERLFDERRPVATSFVAYAELFAGLARKRREGGLGARQYRLAAREVDREWPTYVRVQVTQAVLRGARDLVERHPLRGFDALHLASAVHLARLTREPLAFAAADSRLLDAAAAEGLEALDVSDSIR